MKKSTAYMILGLGLLVNFALSYASHPNGFVTHPRDIVAQQEVLRTLQAQAQIEVPVTDGTRAPASLLTN